MEQDNNETSIDKKCFNKTKSQCNGPKKIACEPIKRKSFTVNKAATSADVALGRLKKSKLVYGQCVTNTARMCPGHRRTEGMFVDSPQCPRLHTVDVGNTSLISMNLSHYELMRNVSQTNCNSEGAFSNTTSGVLFSLSDTTLRDEQLERYFRSAEIWSMNRTEPEQTESEQPSRWAV